MKAAAAILQPGLFDDGQDMPATPPQMTRGARTAPEQCPTPAAPISQHSEPDATDRRSYASLADYIAGRW